MPDSVKIDSLCKMVKTIRITGKDGRGPMGRRGQGRAHAFQHSHNTGHHGIPDSPPPPPPPPPPTTDFDFFDFNSGFEPSVRNCEERTTTLSDIIGDIPMDMVKSYSIKETKNGKKIVIEVNNGPMIDHRDKVIVIRDSPHNSIFDPSRKPQMRKKVIIRSEEE